MGSSQDPDLSDVRIYKRSKDGVAPIVGRSDSTATLGHSSGGGRWSRSPAVGVSVSAAAASAAKDYPELVRRQLRWDSFSDTMSSAKASAASSPAANSFNGIATLSSATD